jgi:hypothetical protein
MPIGKTKNVSLADYRRYLKSEGCIYSRTSGGHEHWTKTGLSRPITFQTHKDPVPEWIIKNNERNLLLCNTLLDTEKNAKKSVSVTIVSKKETVRKLK